MIIYDLLFPQYCKLLALVTFYHAQTCVISLYRVGPDFVTKVQRYVDQNLVDDCLNMHKEPSRLSANHLSMLKQLLDEETACLKRFVPISKTDFHPADYKNYK